MRLPLLIACLSLAACSPQSAGDAANAANETANAADSYQPMEPLNPPAPGTPGGLADDAAPVSEAPFTAESAQGAAQVVQTYYAHLEQGDFRKAWLLWGQNGEASGMSAAAFAASFDRYSEYHANIGAPGEIDAGAGQRYVTVPVQVYGRLKAGNRAFYMLGTVTLHRTVADGATLEQKSWRISSADIKPRPAGTAPSPSPSPTADNRSTARYRCIDGSRLVAAFDPDHGTVTVSRGGRRLAVLTQQRAASGISYAGGRYELRGKGDDMSFAAPGQPPLPCTAIR
ncbi:MliC family protein [Sphingomonas sp. LB-2]|uniref:MliC family protein n=1 Tax=Sphingomonas caeni TaxID=2984949 RepID=UPI0022322A56|nr:MliC family protein [Sphingomonas caeni]MCW3847122.1 MliC family protein [Sphingomonas caeni]